MVVKPRPGGPVHAVDEAAVKAELIVVFKTTHETLSVEKGLKELKVRVRTMIKPRSISSECALALSFRREEKERVEKLCRDKGWRPVGYYRLTEDGNWVATRED